MPTRIPWDETTLPRCRDRRPANTVPYPFVGANCAHEHVEDLEKDAALV